MKCQNCGNELGQEEVFCGQCGSPNATPAQPTEMIQQTSAPRNGLLADAYRSRTSAFPPGQSSPILPTENVPGPQQSAIRQPQQQQAGGFYQDATEAISFVPGAHANYPPSTYPQQGFNDGSPAGGYAGSGQFGSQMQPPQPFMTGNYANQSFNSSQMGLPSGQFTQGGYGSGSGFNAPQPAPKRGNVVMLVGIVCLVFAIITVGVFGAMFALRGNNQPTATPTAQVAATPSPAPSPTPSPAPSPTPTIAVTPTPAPDAGFNWCDTQCTQNGFLIEVYQGWGTQATSSDQGIQFTSPNDQSTYAAVKLPTGNTSVNNLLNNDLNEIASQTNATPAGPLTACATDQPIGGESWTCGTTTLQSNGQNQSMLQAMIYATVYQGKAYVIELVGQQGSFSNDQQTYFNPMLNSFKFVTPAQ
ncbi:MAG TPA: zinc ribbon domain-containing protein [Ktedonobacteraceae bacterium]